MNIKIKKVHPEAITPTYATDGSGCFDLYVSSIYDVWQLKDTSLNPKDTLVFDTGVAFDIPKNHVMLVFSRSGHGFGYNVRLSNCVGVIDSDYRGTVKVKLRNDSQFSSLNIKQGDRIAQAMIIPYPKITFEEVDELSSTERGSSGFGSTGN